MKKKVFALALMTALLFTISGPAFAGSSADTAAQEQSAAADAAPDFSSAIPAIDSTVLCMYECGYECRPTDAEFYWTALCYMLGIYAEDDDRAEFTDTTMLLPREVVEDYAASLFTGGGTLPEIPASLADFVSCSADGSTFEICRGDKGLTEIALGSAVAYGENSWLINGQVIALETEEAICDFEVILTAGDGMFGYTITDLMILKK